VLAKESISIKSYGMMGNKTTLDVFVIHEKRKGFDRFVEGKPFLLD
jgi:hypothetical protein